MRGRRASEKQVPFGAGRVLLQLRHEAGLGSGRVIELTAGRFEIGPVAEPTNEDGTGAPARIAFVLDVSPDETTLFPRSADTWIDGSLVTGPTPIGSDQTIRVAGDLFVAVDPRVRPERHVRVHPPRIQSPESGRRRRRREADERRRRQLSRFALDVDRAAAAEQRQRARDVGLSSTVERAIDRGQALGLRAPAQVAVGLTYQPVSFWPNDLEMALPAELSAIVDRHARVPTQPVVVDLGSGVLGLAGPEESTQAVCRHLLLTLAAAAPGTRAHFATKDRSPWAGLDDHLEGPEPTLTIADNSIADTSAAGATVAGIVLGASIDELNGCDAQLVIDDAGRGVFHRPGEEAVPVVAIGKSVAQTRTLVDRLDRVSSPEQPRATQPEQPRDFSQGAVLVSGSDPTVNNVILATLAIDLLGRPNNDGLEMFIIDRPDRALIRLEQLPQTSGYATADDPDRLVDLLDALDRRTARTSDGEGGDNTAILLVSELGPLTDFLDRLGRVELIDQLDHALRAHDRVELLVAASGPSEEQIGHRLLQRFPSRLKCENGTARLESPSGERALALGDLTGRDLTRAVAGLLSD